MTTIQYSFSKSSDLIQYGDYLIFESRGKYYIGHHETNKVYDESFYHINNALRFIVQTIQRDRVYPNIFLQRERGGYDQIEITEQFDW